VGSDALWRFLQQFPNSPHHEHVLVYAYASSHTVYNAAARPAGLSEKEFDRIRDFYLRRALECSLEFAERYGMPGKAKQTKWPFYEHFLVISKYLNAFPRSDQEANWVVQEWSRRFDRHADAAPHSDFVRLLVLASRNDKAGFLRLLDEIEDRWPDPTQLQWKHAAEIVARVFSDRGWDSGPFQEWRRRPPKQGSTRPATNPEARQ